MFSDLLAVIGRVAAFVGIFYALGVELVLPAKWLGNHLSVPHSAHPLALYAVQEASYAVCGLLAYAFVNRILEKRTLPQAGFAPVHVGRDVATGFLLGLLINGTIFTVLWATGLYSILGRSPHFYPLLVLGLSLCVGIFEETVFRGLLFGLIERRVGTGWALNISSVLFGLAHLGNPDGIPLSCKLMRALAVAVGAGLALGGAYLWTRRLWMPIALHAGWNFLAFTLSNGLNLPNVSAYMMHYPLTLTEYLPTTLVPAAVGVFLLRAAIRRGEWRSAGETAKVNRSVISL